MQKKMLIVNDADITARCRAVNFPGRYMIFPRENRVEHLLPHLSGVEAQVLATPSLGARFVQHELLVNPKGSTDRPINEAFEQFLYLLDGELNLEVDGRNHKMVPGGFCWLPPNTPYQFHNSGETMSRVVWIRRQYKEIEGISIPDPIIANEKDVPAYPVDTYMEQHLTPYEDIGFDMGINLQVFEPGVYFSFVESHVMEHGLYMLYGRGIYWLSGDYIETQKDDFIYMAPYCAQFFYATGWDNSAYLLYKDVNRDYVEYICPEDQG